MTNNDLILLKLCGVLTDVADRITALIAEQRSVAPANTVQQAQPAKCLACEFWQKPRAGHCIRGDGEQYCVKVGTQQA
jgi:hypothetical protein